MQVDMFLPHKCIYRRNPVYVPEATGSLRHTQLEIILHAAQAPCGSVYFPILCFSSSDAEAQWNGNVAELPHTSGGKVIWPQAESLPTCVTPFPPRANTKGCIPWGPPLGWTTHLVTSLEASFTGIFLSKVPLPRKPRWQKQESSLVQGLTHKPLRGQKTRIQDSYLNKNTDGILPVSTSKWRNTVRRVKHIYK